MATKAHFNQGIWCAGHQSISIPCERFTSRVYSQNEKKLLTLIKVNYPPSVRMSLDIQTRWRKDMDNNQGYQSAKKRVEAKMGIYIHLSVYVAVILLLVAINFLSSSRTIWFQWPMLGWGFAVVLHALAVFIFPNRFTVSEKMIEKAMNREHRTP
jgi:hypothetical protein